MHKSYAGHYMQFNKFLLVWNFALWNSSNFLFIEIWDVTIYKHPATIICKEWVMPVYLPQSLGFWPKWRSTPARVRIPRRWIIHGIVIIRSRCRRKGWGLLMPNMLMRRTCCIGWWVEVFLGLLRVASCMMASSLYVCIQCTFCDWPIIPLSSEKLLP